MCWGDPWVSALKTSLANQDLHRKAAGVHTCLPLRPLGHLPPYTLSLGLNLWAQIQAPHGLVGLFFLFQG